MEEILKTETTPTALLMQAKFRKKSKLEALAAKKAEEKPDGISVIYGPFAPETSAAVEPLAAEEPPAPVPPVASYGTYTAAQAALIMAQQTQPAEIRQPPPMPIAPVHAVKTRGASHSESGAAVATYSEGVHTATTSEYSVSQIGVEPQPPSSSTPQQPG